MQYTHQLTLRLSQTDAAGLVFYGRLFDLTQECLEVGLEKVGMPLAAIFRDGEYLLPVVHAEADYQSPLRLGDAIECRCNLEPHDHSVHLRVVLTVGGRLSARCHVVHAVLDPRSGRSAGVPDDLRDALSV